MTKPAGGTKPPTVKHTKPTAPGSRPRQDPETRYVKMVQEFVDQYTPNFIGSPISTDHHLSGTSPIPGPSQPRVQQPPKKGKRP